MHALLNQMWKDMQDLWNEFLCPIGRFFWRPLTDMWKVARGHPEVLPEREGIGWLAGVSMAAYLGIAGSIRAEKWGWLAFFIFVYVLVYVIRTYIWTIIDLGKDVKERLGDDPS